MAKKTSTLFMITQYAEYIDIDKTISALNEKSWKYAVGKHDKDDDKLHYHIVIQTPTQTTIESIANTCNVQPQYVEYGKTSVKFMCGYLTHANDESKVQYTYDEAVIIDKINAKKYIDDVVLMRSISIQPILDKIDNGEIWEYNINDYITQEQYIKYNKSIKLAFEYQNNKHAREVNRNMTVWFIDGKSGSGKTTIAKTLAKECKLEVYITSNGKNPFDNYKGQECVILDDCRPSDFKFNDLLKLLDNNTQSLVGCRYYDKSLWRCKLIIITTTRPLKQWYKDLQESDDEAFTQLSRRISRQYHVQHIDDNGLITAIDDNHNVWCIQSDLQNHKIDAFDDYLNKFKQPTVQPSFNDLDVEIPF